MDSQERSSSLNKYGITYSLKIIFGNYSLLLLSVFLLSIGLLGLLPIETNATSTYYQNNEMYLTGTLIYRGSSTDYEPVNNLNGTTQKIYLNGEAERTLAIEPYLTNMCSQNVTGWLESGYSVTIPYSQRLSVTQPHYSYNSTTRDATAYYDVEVTDIQTNLLYRPQRNNTYITLIVSGLILLSMWCVIKGVRHD